MSKIESQIEAEIPGLRRYARALSGDVSQADDLVQDCLERALSRLTLWRRDSNLRAWLFTILRHVWIDELRRRKIRPELNGMDDVMDSAATAPNQMDRLAVRDLGAALALLAPEQREAVLLVGLEAMSYAEVAAVTGVPVGTVMSRLKRGRDRLALLMHGGEAALRRVK
ncbi:DNA-directed RNA polymerase specialized sigma subunit sigma24-like protein [Paramagnetospirillum magnetotacticum MS-1]|uniref:DNA-directed RNA polymerase specialized sigma subunit sigma24-like protein n=1 Tax=Paramagnetospirillum magnetotacticum MS-1 TaxID=272627 RepID=A0A0C2YVF5_PARME|nr:sigma-70 family RNA polymerase sigma factor [Paramagnetospirillum magnetotacticum]KIL98685.1 DNA-directed RNA polymerase specialized sigma subunit sigma24-like protein [Paramagnetospirillum magnetotacticum MS-1]